MHSTVPPAYSQNTPLCTHRPGGRDHGTHRDYNGEQGHIQEQGGMRPTKTRTGQAAHKTELIELERGHGLQQDTWGPERGLQQVSGETRESLWEELSRIRGSSWGKRGGKKDKEQGST